MTFSFANCETLDTRVTGNHLRLKYVVWVALATLALIIQGCGSNPPTPVEAEIATALSPEQEAQKFEQLAGQTRDFRQRSVYQFLAAQVWYEAGLPNRARPLLRELRPSMLEPGRALSRSLMLANIYSSRGAHVQALSELQHPDTQSLLTGVSAAELSSWAMLTGSLNQRLGNYLPAVNVYDLSLALLTKTTAVESLKESADGLTKEAELAALRKQLWTSLTLLEKPAQPPFRAAETAGWVALAKINNINSGNLSDQLLAYRRWQSSHSEHPAQIAPPRSLALLEKTASHGRTRIALLLPLSGNLSVAGNAILDGFMAARSTEFSGQKITAADPLAPTEILVFDTAKESLTTIMQSLELSGTDLVIGPLEKQRVINYSQTMQSIPTLALNSLPEAATSENPVLGLALDVEDEAVQSAVRALQNGHRRAMVLTPNSEWGNRAAKAFTDHWLANGGELAGFDQYDGNQTHAALLEKRLHVDQSSARERALRTLLGKNLEFTPRRRQDIDMLFLAGSPNQARQLKPMMAFFFAEDIPVYSTSSIYAGFYDSKADRDLDGIEFNTLPWILNADHPVRQLVSESFRPSPTALKMQALGVDSYYLAQRLPQFLEAPETVYHGVIGTLALNPQSRNLDRKQVWARFSGGRARQLPH